MSRLLPTMDQIVLRATGGRTTFSETVAGLPIVYLTTHGARSGLPRTVPLMAVIHDDELAVIGSNWGRPQHPAWVHNLLADPHATVTWHTRSVDVLAHEVPESAADCIWQQARAVYRGFQTYPARTRGRAIRVFLLRTPPS
jgi:deazaflavin-dependent oxidoreductase (nitroreductase family)